MKTPCKLLLPLLAGLFLGQPLARAASIAWTNTVGGSWNVAANWSPNQVPGASDSATIPGGGLNVVVDATNSTGGFTLNSGSSLTVLSNAVLNLVGSDWKLLYGVLTNQGTVNWQGGRFEVLNGNGSTGGLWNQAGALWDIQCDQVLGNSYGEGRVHNAGTVRKVAGIGTTSFESYLDNSGAIQTQTGMLQFTGGGNLGGSYQADSGAAISFSGGNFTLSNSPDFQGPGLVRITGGNVTLNALTGTLDLYGALVAGPSTLAGTLNLYGGGIASGGASSLTVLSNAVLNLVGSDWKLLYGVLTNQGTVNWQGGRFEVLNGNGSTGGLWNQAGALWDIQCDQVLGNSYGEGRVHNAGTLRKSAGSGTTSFGVYLENSGTVQAQAGTILLQNGSDLGGSFQADSGAAVYFGGGSFALNGSVNSQGPGRVGINGSSVWTGVLAGSLNWYGGEMLTGTALTVLSNGVLNLVGGSMALYGPLTNQGTVNWQSGNLTVCSNGTAYTGELWNLASGLWDIRCDQLLNQCFGGERFHNAGTVRKSAGTGTTSFGVYLDNSGNVQAQTGTLYFSSVPYVQTAGFTLLNGGGFSASLPIQILGGTLGGNGLITGTVTNGGVVSPGASPGQLVISGDYIQTTNGTLAIEIAGSTPGTNFDRLVVNGNAVLAGALNVTLTNEFYPALNQTFAFLNAGARIGTFDQFNYPLADVGLQVNYGPTNAAVQVINTRPVIAPVGSPAVNELTPLNLTVSASDPESPGQTLTYALTNSPAGASINATSGQISWTPGEADGPGTNLFTVLVTDNGTPNLTVSRTFPVIVNEVNVAPVLTLPPNTNILEQAAFAAFATATDADLPTNALTFALVSGPAGLTVSPAGLIQWTPTEAQGPGSYTVAVSVTDTNPAAVNAKALSVTNSFQITVQEVNVAPVFTFTAPTNIPEAATFTAQATATDADMPANPLTFALVSGPVGLTVSAAGLIQWTPTEADGPGTNTVTIRVTDSSPGAVNATSLSATGSFQIIVQEVNVAPVLTLPPNTNINELVVFTATATATDADIPTNTLTFALVSGPTGLTVSPAGAIQWTPDESQGPGTNTVTIRVTDTNALAVNATSLSTTGSFQVVVREVNVAPVLTLPPDTNINKLVLWSANATATDADVPANPLTFALVSGPGGLTVSPAGLIQWTPTAAQAYSTNMVTISVTDTNPAAVNATSLSVTGSFQIVVNEVNTPPVLTLPADTNILELVNFTAQATATDADVPANPLTFALVSGPGGLTVSPAGLIQWTPTEAQGPGTNTVTISVTDTNPGAINAKSLSVTNSFQIVVAEVNVAPVLTLPPATNVNELATFTATATATDADLPTNRLTFALVAAPAGMTINATNGVMTWTPGEAQGATTNLVLVSVTDTNPAAVNATSLSVTGSFQIVVNEVNVAPVLTLPPNTNILELAAFSAYATATDADLPVNPLRFALVSGPSGLTVSSAGLIAWTPDETQGGTTNTVTISVTDTNPLAVNATSLSVTGSFQIVVGEINTAPVLTLPANTNVNELSTFIATATATDADVPANPLTFALVSGPSGLAVSPTGAIQWTPTEAQGPSTNTVTISVTDTNPLAVNATSLSVTSSFQIVVNEVNSAPVLTLPPNTNVNEWATFTANATATDADLPANPLTFSLVSGPSGLTVSPAGLIQWTPTGAQVLTTNSVVVSVTDTNPAAVNVKSLSVTNSFQIVVNDTNPPAFYTVNVAVSGGGSVSLTNGTFTNNSVLTTTATPAPGWAFLNWAGDFSSTTNPLTFTVRSNVNLTAVFGTDVASGDWNGIWRFTNSPYFIRSNVVVTNLLIEPGVTALFASNCELRVTGWLQAAGTSNALITFKRAAPAVAWSGLVFTNAATNCVFDYCWVEGANNSGVRLYGLEGSTTNRLTLRGDIFKGNSSSSEGGGLWSAVSLELVDCGFFGNSLSGIYLRGAGACLRGESVVVRGCRFETNSAASYRVSNPECHLAYGGGLYAQATAEMRVENCLFLANSLSGNDCRGAGVAFAGTVTSAAISGCVVGNNTEMGDGGCDDIGRDEVRGAGIYADPVLLLRDTIVTNNYGHSQVGSYGGGAFGARIEAQRCQFVGNVIATRDGDAFGGGLSCASAVLIACRLTGNVATAAEISGRTGFGGGIRCVQGNLNATNCLFANNSGVGAVTPVGGAVYLESPQGLSSLANCTLTGNSPQALASFNGEVRNLILYGNSPFLGSPSLVAYSLVQGGYTGMSNLDVNPLFADTSNYLLSISSPAIDAGDPAAQFKDTSFPPSLGTERNDMGAYGGPFAAWWTNLAPNVPVVLANGQPLSPLQTIIFPDSTPPTISFAGGFPGGSFRYTLNGSNPLTNPTQTTSPFVLTQSAVIRAIAYAADLSSNAIAAPVTVNVVPLYNLNVAVLGGGSVSTTNGTFWSNTVVTLTATSAPGWAFLNWSGAMFSTNNPLALTLNSNVNLTATFATEATAASANGIWRLTNSPYFIRSNLVVTNLLIEPGVTALFASNCELRVTGWLQAAGTSNSLITFKRANPAVAWSGLVFTNAATNCVFDYCWVEGANNSGVRITSPTFSSRHSVFTNDTSQNTHDGGGIYFYALSGSLWLEDCTVAGNYIYTFQNGNGYGGGIYFNGGSLQLRRTVVSGNRALPTGEASFAQIQGAGVYCVGSNSQFGFEDCQITSNAILLDITDVQGYGGGVSSTGGALTFRRCSVTGNQVDGGAGGNAGCRSRGGGICCLSGSLLLEDSWVLNNLAHADGGLPNYWPSLAYGGGVYSGVNVQCVRCVIANNVARGSESVTASGIDAGTATVTLQNCSLTGNASGNYRGGAGAVLADSVFATNCVFAGNSCLQIAGAIYASTGAVVNCTLANNTPRALATFNGLIYNSILYSNTIPPFNSSPTVAYSIVQGGWNGGGSSNVLDLNPLFANTTNYLLAANSPAIDAGDPAAQFKDTSFPPSQGAERNDMGAYGGPFAAWWTNVAPNLPVVLANGQPLSPLRTITFPDSTPPVISFAGGFPGGSFRYTLNGSNPLTNPTQATSPFVLTQSAVIRAIAYSADMSSNAIAAPVTVNVVTFLQLQLFGSPQATNGAFGFGFSGFPDATYSVWASSNLLDWTFFGTATQTASGQFQFSDPTATNVSQRYYQVRSP